jgi:hypothetical protein
VQQAVVAPAKNAAHMMAQYAKNSFLGLKKIGMNVSEDQSGDSYIQKGE